MSNAAVASGADGLIIESHVCPDNSISDARQTIDIESVGKIIDKCRKIKALL